MSAACGESEGSLAEMPMESWMAHLPCALWDTPLHHLAIPGEAAMPQCSHSYYGVNVPELRFLLLFVLQG